MVTSESSDVVLLAHMPLLRIGAETVPFAGGDLWRMPFEAFDTLTVGAFEDHADKYNAAAPVFYRMVTHPELDNLRPEPEGSKGSHRIQAKLPGLRWPMLRDLGLGFIERFPALVADPAWLALLLEAPASLLPQPRWSAAERGFRAAVLGGTPGRLARSARRRSRACRRWSRSCSAPRPARPSTSLKRGPK
jgi:hypothetical protein